MGVLDRYLLREQIVGVALAVSVATFVMVVGFLAQSFTLLARGLPLGPLLLFVLYKVPQLFAYTLPMGVLVATLLLFHRLSGDHEISALRACGLSLPRMVAPLLGLGVVTSAAAAWLHFAVAPELSHRAGEMVREKAVTSVVEFLAPGTYNQLAAGVFVYVGERRDGELRELRLLRFDARGRLREDVMAARGSIALNLAEKTLRLTLEQANLVVFDEQSLADPARAQRFVAARLEYPLDYGDSLNRRHVLRKYANMTFTQLLVHTRRLGAAGQSPQRPLIELHKRAAMSLSPLCFVLLGVVLGLRPARREHYGGMIAALAVALLYFGFIMLVETQYRLPALRPHLLVWLPPLACQAWGAWRLWRLR